MAGLTDFLKIGKPVLDLSGTPAAKTPEAGKYPAMDANLLLVLANQSKITPKAMAALLKPYSWEEAIALYESDDIVDETTFVIVTGKLPPEPKDIIMYGKWRDMPLLTNLAGGPMSFNDVALAQSEQWTLPNDYRASFYGEWRPKLISDNVPWPSVGGGEREMYITIPPDQIVISTLSSDRKRTYSATGRVVRRWDQGTVGYPAGEFEYRYAIHVSRRGA